MITVPITEDILSRAQELYPFDVLNNSIMSGNANIYGAIGEIIVADFYGNKGSSVDFNSTYDYDLIIDGYKVDVKSKAINVTPKPNFSCTVSAFNTSQKCDYYYFMSINKNLKEAYLLGYKKKEEFFANAQFWKKGEIDTDNNFHVRADCYNMIISDLDQLKYEKPNNRQQNNKRYNIRT